MITTANKGTENCFGGYETPFTFGGYETPFTQWQRNLQSLFNKLRSIGSDTAVMDGGGIICLREERCLGSRFLFGLSIEANLY